LNDFISGRIQDSPPQNFLREQEKKCNKNWSISLIGNSGNRLALPYKCPKTSHGIQDIDI